MKLPIFYVKFMKKYIDLSALVEVSEATFYDFMGRGGHFVGFTYRLQGDEEPRQYMRKLTNTAEKSGRRALDSGAEEWWNYPEEEKVGHFYLRTVDGNFVRATQQKTDDELQCVANMRAEMQELLDAWQRWKEIEPQVYVLLRKE